MSKPTWLNTSGCSATSAFFVLVGRCGPGVMLLHGEYGIGDFHRTFTVGEAIDTEKISAELKNGVVTVHLPKSERVKPRRIDVNCC